MEFHAYTPERATHICDIHRCSADQSPLQFISEKELARLKAAEAELAALRQAMVRALLVVPPV